MLRFLCHIGAWSAIVMMMACGGQDNVIQGLVTYIDNASKETVVADSTYVYLYSSIAEFQNHPTSYLKIASTAPNGYYSIYPLPSGPYYIYCERLDTGGVVQYSGGQSTNVSGNETRILNVTMY